MAAMPAPTKLNQKEILLQALTIVERSGISSLSMRTLAEALGVRAPSLYRHYPDRPALEAAMIEVGLSRLLQALQNAAGPLKPSAAFEAAGQAYLSFARSNANLYELLMGTRLTYPPGDSVGRDLWKFVLALISSVSGEPDDTSRAVAFWSFLHGFAELERAGQFGKSGPQLGFEVGLSALLTGFRKRAKS
jgi:AcrR family transcriptional regulator